MQSLAITSVFLALVVHYGVTNYAVVRTATTSGQNLGHLQIQEGLSKHQPYQLHN